MLPARKQAIAHTGRIEARPLLPPGCWCLLLPLPNIGADLGPMMKVVPDRRIYIGEIEGLLHGG